MFFKDERKTKLKDLPMGETFELNENSGYVFMVVDGDVKAEHKWGHIYIPIIDLEKGECIKFRGDSKVNKVETELIIKGKK